MRKIVTFFRKLLALAFALGRKYVKLLMLTIKSKAKRLKIRAKSRFNLFRKGYHTTPFYYAVIVIMAAVPLWYYPLLNQKAPKAIILAASGSTLPSLYIAGLLALIVQLDVLASLPRRTISGKKATVNRPLLGITRAAGMPALICLPILGTQIASGHDITGVLANLIYWEGTLLAAADITLFALFIRKGNRQDEQEGLASLKDEAPQP